MHVFFPDPYCLLSTWNVQTGVSQTFFERGTDPKWIGWCNVSGTSRCAPENAESIGQWYFRFFDASEILHQLRIYQYWIFTIVYTSFFTETLQLKKRRKKQKTTVTWTVKYCRWFRMGFLSWLYPQYDLVVFHPPGMTTRSRGAVWSAFKKKRYTVPSRWNDLQMQGKKNMRPSFSPASEIFQHSECPAASLPHHVLSIRFDQGKCIGLHVPWHHWIIYSPIDLQ